MITVTIVAKNAEETIEKTLQSLSSFSEVLLLDTGSRDKTMQIAKTFPNVVIKESEFLGFGKSHNKASSLAKYDWILSIDSDEVLSKELSSEIFSLQLDPKTVYALNRHNFFRGKWIKGCSGWYPDKVTRLYNRDSTRFTDDEVHEKVLSSGLQLRTLTSPLYHYPYRKISDFLSKMQQYSTLFAQQNKEKKEGGLGKAILHSWATFLKSYLLKKGFLLGAEGFIISTYNAHTAFYKYLKLEEMNKDAGKVE